MGLLRRLAEHAGAAAINWHALRLYRLSHQLWCAGHPTTAMIVAAVNRIITGVEIHPKARFGPRLTIMHGVGIVVHPNVVAGSDCVLFQGVTIGSRTEDDEPPRLGDGVEVFPGAKLLGNIAVGDGARIGANAVVIRDVPPGATVVAPLANVIRPTGSVAPGR